MLYNFFFFESWQAHEWKRWCSSPSHSGGRSQPAQRDGARQGTQAAPLRWGLRGGVESGAGLSCSCRPGGTTSAAGLQLYRLRLRADRIRKDLYPIEEPTWNCCNILGRGEFDQVKENIFILKYIFFKISFQDSSVGLIPRALDQLFEELRGKEFSISVNFIEVYCEKVYDLLSENKKKLP